MSISLVESNVERNQVKSRGFCSSDTHIMEDNTKNTKVEEFNLMFKNYGQKAFYATRQVFSAGRGSNKNVIDVISQNLLHTCLFI